MMKEARYMYSRKDPNKPIDMADWRKEYISKEAIKLHDNDIQICALASRTPGSKSVYLSQNPFKGDSGTALIQFFDNRAHQIGILGKGYVDYGLPITFYSKTSKFIDWIKTEMKKHQ